jgi:hypothetical protein
VKGTDAIDVRPGFAAMLDALAANGTSTIIVETANRFARDLMVQEVGFAVLKERGIDPIAADSPAAFLDDTPTARLIRQVLGAVSEFEKAMLVAKLRGARERKRRTGIKVEGRKSIAETKPETIALAHKLARKPKGKAAPSLRDIWCLLTLFANMRRGQRIFSIILIARCRARSAFDSPSRDDRPRLVPPPAGALLLQVFGNPSSRSYLAYYSNNQFAHSCATWAPNHASRSTAVQSVGLDTTVKAVTRRYRRPLKGKRPDCGAAGS